MTIPDLLSVDASRLQGARVTNTTNGKTYIIQGFRESKPDSKPPLLPGKIYWDMLPDFPCDDPNTHRLIEWDEFEKHFTIESLRPIAADLDNIATDR